MASECCRGEHPADQVLKTDPRSASPDGLHVEGRHPGVAHFGPLFAYGHLPEPLRSVSAWCADLAQSLIDTLSDGPELSAGLRSLLTAKDSFVRVAVMDKKSGALS